VQRRFLSLALTLLGTTAPNAVAQTHSPAIGDRAAAWVATTPGFAFHSDFWLNLHDYLYGIAGGGPDERGGFEPEETACFDARTRDERAGWDAAEAFYREQMGARHHRRDPLMESVRHSLAGYASDDTPDPERDRVLALLRAAAPSYSVCLWEIHDARNRRRIGELVALLVAWGPGLQDELARLYREPWPDTIQLDVVSYSDFAGANTSSLDHTTISSANPSTAGFSGLELALHEASHLMFGSRQGAIAVALRAASEALGLEPPDQLWHALSFYTSGEVVARVARANGDPGFEPYAKRRGLFGTAFRGYLEPIERHWRPYMNGDAELEAALSDLVAAISAETE
jgi:hypothetical protein